MFDMEKRYQKTHCGNEWSPNTYEYFSNKIQTYHFEP